MQDSNDTLQELRGLLILRGFTCTHISQNNIFSTSVTNDLTALVGQSGNYFELRFAETKSRNFIVFNQQYDCLTFFPNGVTVLRFPELLRILCRLKYSNPVIKYSEL